MNNFDEMDELIEELMVQGAIEVVGIDAATGQFLYSFTEKLAEINPEMYAEMRKDFHSSLMRLWEQGFLSMDVTHENPMVKATQKIFDKSAIDKLPQHDRITLEDILNKMSQ